MKIIKKILIALVVLAIAMMSACDNLATPVDTNNSVEVEMGGGEGGKEPIGGITGDPEVQWIRIRVIDVNGTQVGMGTLERTGGTLAFNKKITGLPAGTLDFMVWAGSTTGVADTVRWFGGATKVISENTSISITVATATDGRKGPATGGIIFYVTKPIPADINTGWTYIEAAPSDQSEGIWWSNITFPAIGVTAQNTAIGTGQANTTAIVGQIVDTDSCTSGAAYICDNLTLGGYDDWFLPSKDELDAMHGKTVAIGGFASDIFYWSSSEYDRFNAWCQYFRNGLEFDGNQYHAGKQFSSLVRAIRAF
jgi:hypothetical protein